LRKSKKVSPSAFYPVDVKMKEVDEEQEDEEIKDQIKE